SDDAPNGQPYHARPGGQCKQEMAAAASVLWNPARGWETRGCAGLVRSAAGGDAPEGMFGAQEEFLAGDGGRRDGVLLGGVLGQDLELRAGLHHAGGAVFVREVDLAVAGHRGRGELPRQPLAVLLLAGGGLAAGEEPLLRDNIQVVAVQQRRA